MSEREMNTSDLLDLHLNYGPGNSDLIDTEVWRRWPELELIRGRYIGRLAAIADKQVEAGTYDLDDLTAPNPEMDAEHDRYMAEYKEAIEAIRNAR